MLANYQIRYAQLSDTCRAGLVFDVAEFSDNEVAFYCLDISQNTGNGPLMAMLIRVIFNDLLKRYIHNHHRKLPSMTAILNKLNRLLQEAGIRDNCRCCWGIITRGVSQYYYPAPVSVRNYALTTMLSVLTEGFRWAHSLPFIPVR